MNVLDLFSGIGGFSLGLERTGGFRTVAFCECEPYARAVLKRHWPDVPCYDDVRAVTAARLAADGVGFSPDERRALADADWRHNAAELQVSAGREVARAFRIDCITAGFPCQDISYAGKGAGLAGERSGLWREVARLVGELRPRYVILENVAALLSRGCGDVLGDLAALGYDAEWHCIPASYVGAPHRRDRWWCVAYADQPRLEGWLGAGVQECAEQWAAGARSSPMAHADGCANLGGLAQPVQRAISPPVAGSRNSVSWLTEPDVGRVAHGAPARVDRLRCLGNAVVPQVVEVIGRAILGADRANPRHKRGHTASGGCPY